MKYNINKLQLKIKNAVTEVKRLGQALNNSPDDKAVLFELNEEKRWLKKLKEQYHNLLEEIFESAPPFSFESTSKKVFTIHPKTYVNLEELEGNTILYTRAKEKSYKNIMSFSKITTHENEQIEEDITFKQGKPAVSQ